MANSGGWVNTQQQEMSDFDNADNFSTGDGFSISELNGLDGMCDEIVLRICYSEINQSERPHN
jgi:hypothetical protein